jgi:DNA-binding Lrp family transcriptional regulator
MNPSEVAAQLDDKSIKILRLLLREERFLNPGIPATLLTPTVKKEYGWTNQTVLRRFRKLRDAGLVRLSDVDSTWPEYDRYPRPPKAIERCVEADDLRDVLDHWDGRDTRSPAQLTDDLADLDHRIDATDDRLTGRIDALERKQYGHLRQHALADRERALLRKRALTVAVGAVIAYLLVVGAVVLVAPDLLASVLIGGVGGALGVAVGIGSAVYARGSPL